MTERITDEALKCLADIPADLTLLDMATVPMPFTAADLRDMAGELIRRRAEDLLALMQGHERFEMAATREISPELLAHLRAATSAHVCPARPATHEAA